MRVLLISHTCQSLREGQPKARCLSEMPGVDLMVVSPDRFRAYDQFNFAERPTGVNYRYEILKARWPWMGPAQSYLHHLQGLSGIIKSFKPNVIDIWEEPWSLVSVQTVWLRNRLLPDVPIVSETEQNLDKRLPPPFEWFRRYTLQNAQFVVGRNTDAIQIVRRRGYGGPTMVVPNAVDADLFRPLDRDACRRKLGLGGFIIGYVGRLVEMKGLLDVVQALRLLPPTTRLVLVGEGPMESKLRSLATEKDLAGRIHLLGVKPLSELPEIMNAFDVLALPSRVTPRWKEQFGRVIIEAHACGVPVIGSDSGAIPDVIGQGGITFPSGDIAAIVDRIKVLLANRDRLREYGRNGYERVHRLFTWQAVATRMRSIYTQVCGQNASALSQYPTDRPTLATDVYDFRCA